MPLIVYNNNNVYPNVDISSFSSSKHIKSESDNNIRKRMLSSPSPFVIKKKKTGSGCNISYLKAQKKSYSSTKKQKKNIRKKNTTNTRKKKLNVSLNVSPENKQFLSSLGYRVKENVDNNVSK